MKHSTNKNVRQLRRFPDSEEFPTLSSILLIMLPKIKISKRINHVAKFKSFHKSQKPLIHLTPESYLEYIGKLIPHGHLYRMVKEVVFSLDKEPTDVKYSYLGKSSYHTKLLLSILFCLSILLPFN